MKQRLLVLLLAIVIAVGSGCVGKQTQPSYQLYFLSSSSDHGPALGTEPYVGTAGVLSQETQEPTPGELIQGLLGGPKTEGLTSPFPKGLTFQWWEWDSEKSGNLRVGLSEQYGGLTDIALTLADYCIVLTLSQLEGVESVEIVSEGHTANYRSHSILRAEEAILIEPVT